MSINLRTLFLVIRYYQTPTFLSKFTNNYNDLSMTCHDIDLYKEVNSIENSFMFIAEVGIS